MVYGGIRSSIEVKWYAKIEMSELDRNQFRVRPFPLTTAFGTELKEGRRIYLEVSFCLFLATNLAFSNTT